MTGAARPAAGQIMQAIADAIKARDLEAVIDLLYLLAAEDPHLAGTVYDALVAITSGPPGDTPC